MPSGADRQTHTNAYNFKKPGTEGHAHLVLKITLELMYIHFCVMICYLQICTIEIRHLLYFAIYLVTIPITLLILIKELVEIISLIKLLKPYGFICMKYTALGESHVTNVVGGKVECYICHLALTEYCVLQSF